MSNKTTPVFINITSETLPHEHISCIIRSRKLHPGVEAKRAWLSKRLLEGHVFRKLTVKAPVFIEYAPLETAWIPIEGINYLYIYCLWVSNEYKGQGYGKSLMEYCIEDAKKNRKSGICMLANVKQKAWLSDQAFAKSFGFKVIDTTKDGYELLALSFDGSIPNFTMKAKTPHIENKELTIYYDMQCPYTLQSINLIKDYCKTNQIPLLVHEVDTLEKAKQLPCVFNNWALFYNHEFISVNLILDVKKLHRFIK